MRGFEAIIGQDTPVRLLRFFLRTAKIPHALLFTGIEGVGKKTTARLFAQALNCSQPAKPAETTAEVNVDPCGLCRPCRQIKEGGHPDIIDIAPRKGMLRIDQIRELIQTLALKPFNARHRVVIITDGQTMNEEAGNALLKVLEEPPAGTILILTARQRSDLLPTIASRCRHIRFNPLQADDLAGLLVQQHDMESERARILAGVAGGSCTGALRLSEANWGGHRDWVVGAAGLDNIEAARTRSAASAMAFAAQLALHKDRLGSDLEILKTWIRDLGVQAYQARHIINADRAELLRAMRAHIRDEQVTRLWEAVEDAQKAIAGNSNLRLTLDVMALNMADATSA
jgi:DNA polymerase III subunit delta'